MGQMEGSFELYVSNSFAHECSAFLLDAYNKETTELENNLAEGLRKVREKIRDKRSRLYKQFKEFSLSTQKEFDIDHKHSVWSWIEEERLIGEWFYFSHKEQYGVLFKRLAVNQTDYMRVLATIRQKMDEFMDKYIAEQMTVSLSDNM